MVKSGSGVNFWSDVWCLRLPLAVVFPKLYNLSQKKSGTVSEFLKGDVNGRCAWDLALPRRLSDPEVEEAVSLCNVLLNLHIRGDEGQDQLVWRDEGSAGLMGTQF